MIKYFYKIVEVFIDFSKSKVTNFFKDMFFKSDVKPGKKNFWCKIGIGGCFVKDTPVLMASNPLINTTAAYAMAALPIVSIPIQDVQLFDYAVAHKSVNSSYGLEANNVETFIIGKDPYTSDQQRSRDQYEIDDKNWNEVTFEQVLGSSKCKLALHNDYNRLVSDEGRKSSDTKSLDKEGTATNWIAASTNSLKVGDIHYMNLPEQGISGPFKITSIRHITPQKKPIDEDSTDDYEYRPVTGLFLHESNDVWKLRFDDGSELGVTNNHPIFSVSKGDWQHAGHLEIGEEVLAKSGNTKVVSKERDQTLQPVYNLEVKDLHNFLVGAIGVVVHNTPNCLKTSQDFLDKLGIKKALRKPGKYDIDDGPNANKIKEKFNKDPNKKIEICYDDTGFPDFSDFIPSYNGKKIEFPVSNMTGNHSNDMVKARNKLKNDFGLDFNSNGDIVIPGYEGITWTFHHHQDGETMQLVPYDINNKADHVGGAKIIEKGGKGNYLGPDKISKTACN